MHVPLKNNHYSPVYFHVYFIRVYLLLPIIFENVNMDTIKTILRHSTTMCANFIWQHATMKDYYKSNNASQYWSINVNSKKVWQTLNIYVI